MGRKKGSIHKDKAIPANDLREVLKPIHNKLRQAGVPDARLPSNESLVSHILDWVDDDKIDDWVTKFAEVEGTDDE